MLLKRLKLNAKDAIRSGAVATRSSGSVTLAEDLERPAPSTRAASVSSSGTACSAPVQTRNQYGKPIQMFTRRHETFAHVGSKSHGMLVPRAWLMTPNSSFKRPRQTSTARNAGIGEREDEQRPLEPDELEARLVQRDREEEPDRELDEHGEERVYERPGEDPQERARGRAGR